jgi:hypothetical protein
MAHQQQQQPRPGASPSRTVAIAVGNKHSEDTKMLWRFTAAHVLEREHDKVVIIHVRTESPLGWVPISVGQSVAGDAVRAVEGGGTESWDGFHRPHLVCLTRHTVWLMRRRAGCRRRCGSA